MMSSSRQFGMNEHLWFDVDSNVKMCKQTDKKYHFLCNYVQLTVYSMDFNNCTKVRLIRPV